MAHNAMYARYYYNLHLRDSGTNDMVSISDLSRGASKKHLIRVQLLSYIIFWLPSDMSQFCDSCRSQLLPCGAKPTVRCLELLSLQISTLSKELVECALSLLTLICWTNTGLCCLLS